MKKMIIIATAAVMLAGAPAFATLTTNSQNQIIDTYTNAMHDVIVAVVGYASSTVSPYSLTPDTDAEVLAVTDGGTYVVDPDETAGTIAVTLAAARHGEVLRLVILPATNAFTIVEGTTGQFATGTITQTGAGTNDLIELWGVGVTWREANSSTLIE